MLVVWDDLRISPILLS